jgi:polyisoprenoid-binding protein YceI
MREAILSAARASIVRAALVLLWIPAAGAATRTFAVDASASTMAVHVGKTGIGSFAGHEHDVVVQAIRGEVVFDPADLAKSSVDLSVIAASLKVSDKDEPPEDLRKVQQTMTGPQVLDAARHRIIRFRSREVTGKQAAAGPYQLTVAGDLSLHGVEKAIVVPLQLESAGDTLTATGTVVVKQTDFGIEPVSAAGGLVKVEDEVTVTFKIVARAANP